jgi:hypothetical membrane protein
MRGALEDRHPDAAPGEVHGSRQAGQAGPDHHDMSGPADAQDHMGPFEGTGCAEAVPLFAEGKPAQAGYGEAVNTVRAAAGVWIIGAAAYLVSEAVAARTIAGYSYSRDYISDLGVAWVMNAGFVVHGLLFLVGAILVTRSVASGGRAFVCAAAVNALGNIVIAVFPSHIPGAEHWHLTGAALAILGGNVAVILGGRLSAVSAYRRLSVGLGLAGIACLAAVAAGAQPAGLIERGSVYPIVVWELLAAAVLLARSAR